MLWVNHNAINSNPEVNVENFAGLQGLSIH